MKSITKVRATIFTFSLIIIAQSCKREVDFGQIEKQVSVEQAKIWYDQQSDINASFSGIKANSTQSFSSKTKKQILQKIAGRIQWSSSKKFSSNNQNYLMVEINDSDVKFKSAITASRWLIFYYGNSGFLEMNIVESITKNGLGKLEQEKAIEKAFLGHLQGVNPKNTNGNRIFLYDSEYKRCERFEKGGIRESISRRNLKVGSNVESSLISNNSISEKTNTTGCQLWGVYAITRDQNYEVISEELLYTYYVGDCSGGEPGVNTEDNPDGDPAYGGDEEANQVAFFESYIGMDLNSTSFTSSSDANTIDPISGTFVWTVVTGHGLWSIEAATDYSYYHTEYFDVSLMRNVQVYDLFRYNTRRTYFTGFNIAIETTWTPTSVYDYVVNNNTENTKGISTVSGVIHHVLKLPLPGNVGFLDRTVTVPPVSCNFYPR